jgi:hypothetical protein
MAVGSMARPTQALRYRGAGSIAVLCTCAQLAGAACTQLGRGCTGRYWRDQIIAPVAVTRQAFHFPTLTSSPPLSPGSSWCFAPSDNILPWTKPGKIQRDLELGEVEVTDTFAVHEVCWPPSTTPLLWGKSWWWGCIRTCLRPCLRARV